MFQKIVSSRSFFYYLCRTMPYKSYKSVFYTCKAVFVSSVSTPPFSAYNLYNNVYFVVYCCCNGMFHSSIQYVSICAPFFFNYFRFIDKGIETQKYVPKFKTLSLNSNIVDYLLYAWQNVNCFPLIIVSFVTSCAVCSY